MKVGFETGIKNNCCTCAFANKGSFLYRSSVMQLRKVMLSMQEAGSTGTGAVHEYWGLSPQWGSFILLHRKVGFLISWVIAAWPCPVLPQLLKHYSYPINTRLEYRPCFNSSVLRVMQSIPTLLLSAFWWVKNFSHLDWYLNLACAAG